MNEIVKDDGLTFKVLEQKIFYWICLLGVEITRSILEKKDRELMEQRDKKKYRDKGKRTTTVKTVYGEVTYDRHVYKTVGEDGKKTFVYLLDEAMQMERVGLISANLAEKIADAVTEMPYRVAAETVTQTTGQRISAGGAWRLIQELGERVRKEELGMVARMEAGETEGTMAVPVLFEEMDGIYIRTQGPHHEKRPMQEVKVATTYEGWDAEGEQTGRASLVGKRVIAGIEEASVFHEKREAALQARYDVEEIGQRVLNGDGGSWIKEENDPETIVQLDPFHLHKAIREHIFSTEARAEIEKRLAANDPDSALEYIGIYADSVDMGEPEDKTAENAKALVQYLSNNKAGLVPWKDQCKKVPEPPKGIVYKNMGVQENQNCTVITMRMKHRRMRWSKGGGDSMAKALYRKENGELHKTINDRPEEYVFNGAIQKVAEVILSAASAPKKDGIGSPYASLWSVHMPILDAALTEGRKVFRRMAE